MSVSRLLFVITYLDCGGICRSLQSLLNKYDASKYEIDVFSMVHSGLFCGELRNCRLIKKDYWVDALISRYDSVEGLKKVPVALIKIISKIWGHGFRDRLFKKAGSRILHERSYNKIIAFSEGIPTRFVSMMEHPHKIAWIHCDYSSYSKMNTGQNEQDVYSNYERIICVSDYTRKSFLNYYPALNDRTSFIYNLLDTDTIRALSFSVENPKMETDTFNIVSVGRIDPIKRFSMIPQIASDVLSRCSSNNRKIKWYIIGPRGGRPDEYRVLVDSIRKYGLYDVVILTGEKFNPYYYIANANLLVNISVSEACPYVINEARVLGTPCVCTDFGSSYEFVNDCVDGIITSIDNIVDAVSSLILDEEKYQLLKDGLKEFHYNTEAILTQYDKVFQ